MRRALDPQSALDYSRPSITEAYTEAVREMLADYPRITVNQVAELVEWPGARRTLSDLVATLRPAALEREREDLIRPSLGAVATGRIVYGPLTLGRMTVGSIHVDPEETRLDTA